MKRYSLFFFSFFVEPCSILIFSIMNLILGQSTIAVKKKWKIKKAFSSTITSKIRQKYVF